MASLEETAKSFQSKFESMIKNITILSLPMQKKSFECCVSCFDGDKQDPEKIAACISRCHEPSQSFNQVLQREVEGLQTSIESCQRMSGSDCTASSSKQIRLLTAALGEPHVFSCALFVFTASRAIFQGSQRSASASSADFVDRHMGAVVKSIPSSSHRRRSRSISLHGFFSMYNFGRALGRSLFQALTCVSVQHQLSRGVSHTDSFSAAPLCFLAGLPLTTF
ncbi:hypothetical protein Esti_005154 [Eimeria stiedai]